MNDLGINKFLEDTFGKTIDGFPIFRLLWTTNITERRHSTFKDFHDDIFIREVTETREVLKYPFAQNRWVLERIHLITPKAYDLGLRTNEKYGYEEVYTFQDKNGRRLPLTRDMTEAAIFLYFKYYLAMTPTQRLDMRMKMLADKDKTSKAKTREALGDSQSPFGFVLESIKRSV